MQKIDKVLGKIAREYNLEDAYNRHLAIKNWKRAASAFVLEAAQLTEAIDFKKGALTVACLSKEVAAKIKVLVVRIIAVLNQLLGRQLVFAVNLEL